MVWKRCVNSANNMSRGLVHGEKKLTFQKDWLLNIDSVIELGPTDWAKTEALLLNIRECIQSMMPPPASDSESSDSSSGSGSESDSERESENEDTT
jgi:hypothetical protein